MKQGFVIHHNGPNVGIGPSASHARCEAYWNGVRNYHVGTKGWSDIAYSFGVCIHGKRFVGRGWDRNQFANGSDVVGVDDGKDSEWFTVLVFLGWNDNASDPVDELPTAAMIAGVRALIAEGRDTGRCGTRVLPHNAFKPKRCPGAAFTDLAAKWNHAPLQEPVPAPEPQEDLVYRIVWIKGAGKRGAAYRVLYAKGKDDKEFPVEAHDIADGDLDGWRKRLEEIPSDKPLPPSPFIRILDGPYRNVA